MLGGAISMATAKEGGHVAWVVPTYTNGRSLWRWAENVTANLRANKYATANKTERIIEFPTVGGLFGIYSADNEDAIRGEAFHLVVIDEAARVKESAWTDAIQPTLADYNGDAILISTPKGMNWFFSEWSSAKNMMNGDMAAWQAPTRDNPNPKIQAAYEKAKTSDRVPELTFRQEWNAEFVEGGAFFQNIQGSAVVTQKDIPDNHKEHRLLMSADWGKANDFSCFGVGCATCNKVVDWEHFNKIDYIYQRERLESMYNRWKPIGVLPERNSMGEPNVELLRQSGLRILRGTDEKFGFYTTPTNKPPLIEGLAQAFLVHGFLVPEQAKSELTAYELNIMASGHNQFGAPGGMHDDWVTMLALLWWAMTKSFTGSYFGFAG